MITKVMENEDMEEYCYKIQSEVVMEIEQFEEISDEEILEYIEKHVLEMGHVRYLSIHQKEDIVKTVFNAIRKYDVLQELLEDDSITEIMVNGPDNIFLEREGKLERYSKKFTNKERLEEVIQQIVAKVNRRVNEASPIVDVRLLDGSRVNVVLPPVAINGPIVTIRKFPEQPFSMERLIEIGSLTEEVAHFLEILVRSRYNIFVSGGTGSGKTTFLNCLGRYIPRDERIITVEDSAELQLSFIPNLVRLEVRTANVEGKNEVTTRDLLKSALRMRPDRVILGEVRDAAACEMLTAMGTGHDGSLCTGHANSPADMLARLETLVLTGMDIPLAAVRSQIASSIDIVIQLGRLRDKSRRVLEIDEVIGMKKGEIELQTLYRFEELGEEQGKISGVLKKMQTTLFHQEKLRNAGLEI